MADANMYVLNPFFQTRSFDDMVKPLTLYALAYKEQEAKIEDMTDKAAALEWIANQDPESQTAALYRDMSTKIKGIRDDMMINGLQGGTRSRILGARRMYSANSAEITRRYEDMKKYQERMEQMYDKDNSMIFSPESQNVSLDSFAGGKRPKIKAISGNEIMARGAAIGKRLTSQIFGDGVEGTIAGEQFWKFYKENGMTDEALAAALNKIGQDDKFSLVKKVMDGVYNSFADFDPVDQQTLKDKFMEGIYSGAVYSRDVEYKENGEYISKAQREAIRQQDEQLRLSQAESDRQNLALQLQGLAGGYKVDLDNKTITPDLSKPYRNVSTDKDGNTTFIEAPYLPDGTIDKTKITIIKTDKNGNILSSTGQVLQKQPQPGWSVNKTVSQQAPVLSQAQRRQAEDQGDEESFITITNKNGNVDLFQVTGERGKWGALADRPKDNIGSNLEGLHYENDAFPHLYNSKSLAIDWAGDVDGDLKNSQDIMRRTDSKYRKWVRVEPGKMTPSVDAAYQKALAQFMNSGDATHARNIDNYQIYCLMDPEDLSVPTEFRFESNARNNKFRKTESDKEAQGILNVRKIAEEAAEMGRTPTKTDFRAAYDMGAKEGKVARYAPRGGGNTQVQTDITTPVAVQDVQLTPTQKQKEDSLLEEIMKNGGLPLKK